LTYGFIDQFVDLRGPVQHRIVGMDMEVHEVVGHADQPSSRDRRLGAAQAVDKVTGAVSGVSSASRPSGPQAWAPPAGCPVVHRPVRGTPTRAGWPRPRGRGGRARGPMGSGSAPGSSGAGGIG